ncbi:MAG: hypothetical protein GY707_17665 [Desulfobacteraceae bacterium]|nr:hypothetical protein [Desulfobacteraceae bacterium]
MGDLKPTKATLNFIAASPQVLRKEIQKTQINCNEPGVIRDVLNLAKLDKSHEICIDGKRINSGYGKALGEVNLYSHETNIDNAYWQLLAVEAICINTQQFIVFHIALCNNYS